MKLTGQREDGDATAHSPPMHISDEDTLIASTLLNMAQTQVQMLGKINEVQADQKTILEELRRERSQSQMFIGILQKCHEGELERLMKVMTLFCERTRVYEQQQPTAATTQAVNSAAFSAANMGTPGGVQRAFIPSAAAYGSQATPSTFFGAAPITDDGAYAQYLYLQQQIAAQQQRMMVPQGGISGSSLGTVGYSSLSGADMLSFASPSKPGFGAAVPPPVAAYSSPQVIAAAQKVTAPPVQQQQQNAFGITANRMPATQQPFVGAVPNITSSGPPPTLTPAFVSESKEPPKGTAGTTTFSFSNAASATTTSASGHAQPPGTKTTTPLAVKLSGGFTFGISTSQSSAIAAAQKSPAIPKTEPAGKEGEEDEVPEFEPSAHFEPVIPLPDLVEVTTGEENEKVVFAERCKLYRFAKEGNEWKERGVGVLKILQDPSTGRYRIVMRREQIHKVCANHKIQAAMSLTPMQKSDRAYVWLAQDFSEGEVAEEKLAARFKTVDIAKKFFDTFKMARDAAAAAESPVKSGGQATTTVKEVSKEKKTDKEKSAAKTDGTPKGFGDAFKPAAGSWECKTCYVRNNGDVSVCPCCNTSKDGTSANASAQSASIFASKPMSTVAPLKGDSGRFSFGLSATSTATTVATASPQPALSAGLDKTPVAPTFGLPSLASPSEPAKTTHPTSTAAGATAAAVTTTTPKFGFAEKVKSGVPAVSSAPNFNLFATLSTTTAPVSLPKPTFSLGTQAPKEAIITTTTSVAAPASVQSVTMPSFSFKFPTSGHATKPSPTQSVSVFGGPAVFGAKPVVALDKKQTSGSPAEKPKTSSTFGGSPGMALFGTSSSVFGGGLSGGGSGGFAALAAMAKAEPAKEKKETVSTSSTTITPFGGMAFNNVGTSVFSSPASEKKEEGKTKSSEKASPKGNHSEGEEEFVPTAHFEPVIPTPPLIQVKTGEENEKVLFKARAKLYRFVEETKEYKERGVGEIKVLLNEENGKCRIVMRREQVLKVCANAPLLSGMTIKKKPSTENACMWICKDYAEEASGSKECFVARFKEVALADEFISVFRDACDGKFAKGGNCGVKLPTAKGEQKSASSEPAGATSPVTVAIEGGSGEDEGAGPMGTRGVVDEVDYDEDPYEELADFPAKMTITEGFASPLKPAKTVEVKGSYSVGIQHDVGAMKIDLLDKEGVVELTHFIMSDTAASSIGPKSMKYMAVDEKSKNKQIVVEFEKAEDRDKALKHIAEGVQLASEVGDEENEDD